jgi:hypothetical protein
MIQDIKNVWEVRSKYKILFGNLKGILRSRWIDNINVHIREKKCSDMHYIHYLRLKLTVMKV